MSQISQIKDLSCVPSMFVYRKKMALLGSAKKQRVIVIKSEITDWGSLNQKRYSD